MSSFIPGSLGNSNQPNKSVKSSVIRSPKSTHGDGRLPEVFL